VQLSREAITSFQRLYKDKCGVLLSDDEAQALALKELKRFAVIYQPIPKKDSNFLNSLKNIDSNSIK
jgi:hypothetical protein